MSNKKRWKSEKEFNQLLVKEYLKWGSVDESFKQNNYDLPISYANYHRVLDRWGIVKAAGPNSKLTESIEFLSRFSEESGSLEAIYRKTPRRFQSSLTTMHRILGYIKEGVTRRLATALVVSPYKDNQKILVAKDISVPRLQYGKKFGALTIPMGFSRKRDTREIAIKRVLQQEVFSLNTVENKFPHNVIPNYPKPFLFLDVLDVRVEVYHIELPKKYSNINDFSSFKLKDFRFFTLKYLLRNRNKNKLRVGVRETLDVYKKHQKLMSRKLDTNPFFKRAELNTDLAR